MNPGNQIPASADYKISKASLGDVAGILSIIRPLERTGAIVKRSRESMEQDIEFFLVESSHWVATVFHHGEMAEPACIAVHSDYRGKDHIKHIGTGFYQPAKKSRGTMSELCLF